MLASPAPFRWCYSRPVPAVGGEYAMEACQVDSGLGHQGRQPGDRRADSPMNRTRMKHGRDAPTLNLQRLVDPLSKTHYTRA